MSVEPLGIARPTAPVGGTTHEGGATDIDRLAASLAAAWRSLDRPAPRRPWPDPLPAPLDWPIAPTASRGDGGPTGDRQADRSSDTAVVLGLADDPDHQRTTRFRWALDRGPLLGVGLPGAGAGALAATVVLAAADRWGVGSHHLHVLDGSGAALLPLAGLAQVGAVVTAPELERQRRLIQDLRTDLGARRAGGPTRVRRILVVHGVTALQARWDDAGLVECWPQLLELVTEGTPHGIHVCCTAESAAVPHRLVAACEQRIVFRLGDPGDHAAFGIAPRHVPPLPTGRGLSPTGHHTPTLVQVASPADGLAGAVARLSGRRGPADHGPPDDVDPPPWVGVLPDLVTPADMADAADTGPGRVAGRRGDARTAAGGLVLPIGLADDGLVVATVELAPAGHAIVSGPPRAGRSTALAALARAAGAVEGLRVVLVDGGSSSASACGGPDGGDPWPTTVERVEPGSRVVDDLVRHEGPLLVLVDDADLIAEDHAALHGLATARRLGRHVVASGRNDRFRARYGHWTRELRADGVGLLLVPDLDLDGDLLGVRLPRRPAVALVPGRAWSVGPGTGAAGFVQVVRHPPERNG